MPMMPAQIRLEGAQDIKTCPTEPDYSPLKVVKVLLSWLLKPADQDLHCFHVACVSNAIKESAEKQMYCILPINMYATISAHWILHDFFFTFYDLPILRSIQ